MYRKTLIALACGVISAPAFAQTSLPPCPDKLTHHQTPCTNLTPPSPPTSTPYITWKPSPDFGLDRRPVYEKYGWGQNPQGPASTSDVIKKRLDCNHPTYRGGAIGWETCR